MIDFIQNWFLDPTALLFMASLATILLMVRWQQRSARHGTRRKTWLVICAWAGFFLAFSSPNMVNPLLLALENQHPESFVCAAGSHLVLLGGGIDSRAKSRREFEHMSESTLSRATAAARIAEREPGLRMVTTGGAVKNVAEADVIASYWIALGIDDTSIIREARSANTRENALNVASLLTSESIEGPIRLVTSALHMPRALRTFRKVFDEQDIEVCPVSVDRAAKIDRTWWAWMPQTTVLWKSDKLFHELLAIGVYRLRGWI